MVAQVTEQLSERNHDLKANVRSLWEDVGTVSCRVSELQCHLEASEVKVMGGSKRDVLEG